MNATTDRDWKADANAIDIEEAAAALGIERKGRGFIFPHPGCDGVYTSGGYSVYHGTKTNRLHCRRCSGAQSRFDVCDLIAITLGLDPQRMRSADWQRVQGEAARHGWCLSNGRKVSPMVEAAWRAERATADAQRASRAILAESERRAGAIDVHRAWSTLTEARIGHGMVIRWVRDVRGFPEGLLAHLPFDSLAAVPAECPDRPAGVRADDWHEAVRLMRAGYAVDRRILIALRDVEGRPVGASRRWHRAMKPTDGLAKALSLGPRLCLEGRPVDWPGGCAIFGDFPMAIARARRGEPLFICEGGPDWLLAESALRRSQYGAALATPGVSTLPKLAGLLREALWGLPAHGPRPRVVIIPHRGDAGERAVRECVGELRNIASITIRRTGADDFNDMVQGRSMTAEAVIDFLLGGRW